MTLSEEERDHDWEKHTEEEAEEGRRRRSRIVLTIITTTINLLYCSPSRAYLFPCLLPNHSPLRLPSTHLLPAHLILARHLPARLHLTRFPTHSHPQTHRIRCHSLPASRV